MNKELHFIKVMLVIISLLLVVQIAGPIWQPQAQAETSPAIQDVNLVQLADKKLDGPFGTSPYARVAISVKIVD
jgi:ABC-type dipeptide/oligopeptide/nickel transport system permease subunit